MSGILAEVVPKLLNSDDTLSCSQMSSMLVDSLPLDFPAMIHARDFCFDSHGSLVQSCIRFPLFQEVSSHLIPDCSPAYFFEIALVMMDQVPALCQNPQFTLRLISIMEKAEWDLLAAPYFISCLAIAALDGKILDEETLVIHLLTISLKLLDSGVRTANTLLFLSRWPEAFRPSLIEMVTESYQKCRRFGIYEFCAYLIAQLDCEPERNLELIHATIFNDYNMASGQEKISLLHCIQSLFVPLPEDLISVIAADMSDACEEDPKALGLAATYLYWLFISSGFIRNDELFKRIVNTDLDFRIQTLIYDP